METNLKLTFTAVAGRSGSNYLTLLINKYAKNCFSECEAPDLIHKGSGFTGSLSRSFQRKWIVTEEMLGRGKALEWYEQNKQHPELDKIVKKKIRRIYKLKNKHEFNHYIETGKFFIKTHCDAFYKNFKNISIIKLSRNPLLNAKSYLNRNKNFYLDNVRSDSKQNCLQIDPAILNKYQLYLWNWFETELRYYRFIEKYSIGKRYEIKTEELSDIKKIKGLFDFFNIEYDQIIFPEPINTNAEQGIKETKISRNELDDYLKFLDIIPNKIIDKIKYLEKFDPISF